jgi:transcriptional regulator GlxA family with amidase domain
MRIVLVAFEGAQGLDVFGPAEVFAAVNRASDSAEYEIVLASVGGGRITASSGIGLVTVPLAHLTPRRNDTVLVVGGDTDAIRVAVRSPALIAWLERAARVVRRIGSVCSGAFLLAQAGILDGRRATTHWLAQRKLSAFRPAVTVDTDAIFVQDGKVWTSAGVTTGIDMALALVEEDCGRKIADSVAARLVVYARRPGFQAQFSEALISQTSTQDGFSRALSLARKSPARKFGVSELARSAGMSLRTLHRRCLEEVGTTPAKLIERLRVEHAKLLISTTALEAKVVAARSGFENPARMAHAFQRTLGLTPSGYRALFARKPTLIARAGRSLRPEPVSRRVADLR